MLEWVLKWMVLPRRLGTALGGLLAGIMVGFEALPLLVPPEPVIRLGSSLGLTLDLWGVLWVLIAVGAAAGVVIGLIVGAIPQRGQARSETEVELEKTLRRNFPDIAIGVQVSRPCEIGSFSIRVAQASLLRSSSDDGDTPNTPSRQTLACYQATAGRLPRISVQPMKLQFKLAGAMGFRGLRFADPPEFSERYLVLTSVPRSAEELLDERVRAWLLAHPGMCVETGGMGAVAFREGQLLKAGELDAFAVEAAELLRLLERARRLAEKSRPPTAMDEARAFAAQMPGSMQRSMERQLRARRVTREDVDAFLRQVLPRKIPGNIAYHYQVALSLTVIASVFVAAGSVMGYLVISNGVPDGIPVIATFFLAVAPFMFFSSRSWWRQRQLLRRGEAAAAKVLRFRDTGMVDNGGPLFEVTARYHAAGESRTSQCKVHGESARRLVAEGTPGTVLYDPVHPERILLVDGLVNA